MAGVYLKPNGRCVGVKVKPTMLDKYFLAQEHAVPSEDLALRLYLPLTVKPPALAAPLPDPLCVGLLWGTPLLVLVDAQGRVQSLDAATLTAVVGKLAHSVAVTDDIFRDVLADFEAPHDDGDDDDAPSLLQLLEEVGSEVPSDDDDEGVEDEGGDDKEEEEGEDDDDDDAAEW